MKIEFLENNAVPKETAKADNVLKRIHDSRHIHKNKHGNLKTRTKQGQDTHTTTNP